MAEKCPPTDPKRITNFGSRFLGIFLTVTVLGVSKISLEN